MLPCYHDGVLSTLISSIPRFSSHAFESASWTYVSSLDLTHGSLRDITKMKSHQSNSEEAIEAMIFIVWKNRAIDRDDCHCHTYPQQTGPAYPSCHPTTPRLSLHLRGITKYQLRTILFATRSASSNLASNLYCLHGWDGGSVALEVWENGEMPPRLVLWRGCRWSANWNQQ